MVNFINKDMGFTRLFVNYVLPNFVNDKKNIKALKSEINAYLVESNTGALEEAKMLEQMTKAAKRCEFWKYTVYSTISNK